jgi:hypothetical protein
LLVPRGPRHVEEAFERPRFLRMCIFSGGDTPTPFSLGSKNRLDRRMRSIWPVKPVRLDALSLSQTRIEAVPPTGHPSPSASDHPASHKTRQTPTVSNGNSHLAHSAGPRTRGGATSKGNSASPAAAPGGTQRGSRAGGLAAPSRLSAARHPVSTSPPPVLPKSHRARQCCEEWHVRVGVLC